MKATAHTSVFLHSDGRNLCSLFHSSPQHTGVVCLVTHSNNVHTDISALTETFVFCILAYQWCLCVHMCMYCTGLHFKGFVKSRGAVVNTSQNTCMYYVSGNIAKMTISSQVSYYTWLQWHCYYTHQRKYTCSHSFFLSRILFPEGVKPSRKQPFKQTLTKKLNTQD